MSHYKTILYIIVIQMVLICILVLLNLYTMSISLVFIIHLSPQICFDFNFFFLSNLFISIFRHYPYFFNFHPRSHLLGKINPPIRNPPCAEYFKCPYLYLLHY